MTCLSHRPPSSSLPRNRANPLLPGSPLSPVNAVRSRLQNRLPSYVLLFNFSSHHFAQFAGIADTLLAGLPTQFSFLSLSFIALDLSMIASCPIYTIPAIWTASSRQVLTWLCPHRVRNFYTVGSFYPSPNLFTLLYQQVGNIFMCLDTFVDS